MVLRVEQIWQKVLTNVENLENLTDRSIEEVWTRAFRYVIAVNQISMSWTTLSIPFRIESRSSDY